MNHKEDYLQIDAQTMITELRKLSDKYCHCYGEKIDLETAIKRKEADLYLK